ncbi:MAG TPA: transglutaminase family protein [Verrucomicrobiae bacterium]|jgi:transglutaminase-like putative cysteine protease|nr:transglutaminase family protein [Verrucomicrobiae bacterium]
MNYAITHRTTYEYAAPVAVSHHVARLEPRQTAVQSPVNFSLKILPQPVLRKARADYFGNQLCFFSVQETHRRLDIIASSRVEVRGHESAAPENSPSWEEVANLFRDPVAPEVISPYQFVFDSPHVRASLDLADYAHESFAKGRPLLEASLDLTRRIFTDFKYDSKATTIVTPLEEVLEKRRGVCQDFAHLTIACLRSIGLPARYVSGYLRTRPPEGKEKLVGADASHAWISVFCPRNGWRDFDPTNNLQVSTEHITVAFGRDFSDVSPVAGILTGGGQHEVKVSVDVEELK